MRGSRRRWRRSLVVIAVALVVAGTVLVMSYSARAPYYEADGLDEIELGSRMRTWEEHDAIVARTGGGYLFRHEVAADGALLFFGAVHTADRADPQIAELERLWREFEPTVALMEGRRGRYFLGPLFPGIAGEAEVVHELARRDDVPMFSLEPSYASEVAYLLDRWTPEQLALFFTLRVYESEAGGEADEGLAEHLLGKRTDVEGLRGALESVDDIDRVWNRDFPEAGDWRSRRGLVDVGYLRAIGDDSRAVRGEHMARTLIDLVRKGERVFAVAGSGHVIRLEPILHDAFGTVPPTDLDGNVPGSRVASDS